MNVVIILLSQSHTQKSPLVPGQASTIHENGFREPPSTPFNIHTSARYPQARWLLRTTYQLASNMSLGQKQSIELRLHAVEGLPAAGTVIKAEVRARRVWGRWLAAGVCCGLETGLDGDVRNQGNCERTTGLETVQRAFLPGVVAWTAAVASRHHVHAPCQALLSAPPPPPLRYRCTSGTASSGPRQPPTATAARRTWGRGWRCSRPERSCCCGCVWPLNRLRPALPPSAHVHGQPQPRHAAWAQPYS
jgi:hypothetical protein